MSKKELIASTYRDLVIKNKTSKITVKEICSSCHISRTTFYKYFKDSYEIIEYTLINDAITPTYELVEHSTDYQSVIINWYLSFYKHKDFYIIAIKDYGQNSLFDTIIINLTKLNIELYNNEFSFDDPIDTEYYAYKHAAMQAMLLKKWMQDGMHVTPIKMAEYFYKDLSK